MLPGVEVLIAPDLALDLFNPPFTWDGVFDRCVMGLTPEPQALGGGWIFLLSVSSESHK